MSVNQDTIGLIKQRLEILWQLVESLETGGGSGDDAYTKAQTDALLNGKVDKVAGSSLMTTAQANKLAGIQSGAEVNVQADWDQTDTTADDFIKNKPVIPDTSDFYTKSEIDSELSGKVDKQTGYSLISNANITKLNGIENGAEVNVQANWNETDTNSDSYIRNKPAIPDLTNYYTKTEVDTELNDKVDKQAGYSLISDSNITKLNGIAAGAEVNVQANWNETNVAADSYIRNKPTIPDLTNYYNKTETTAQIQGAIADLDVSQTASTGHYIDYIAQENGLIVPHSRLSSTVPTTSDTTLITSGGVKSALNNYYTKTEADNNNEAILENDGVKNLVGYNLTVPQELTATVNADGSLTVVANTTAVRRLTIATDLSKLVDGNTYILSGCSDGNSDTTYHLGITRSNYAGLVYQANSEVSFTKTSEMALLVLTVRAGQNWTKTFYPMIRKASIGNSDFIRYAPNNYELWEMIKALQPATTNSLRTLSPQEEVIEEEVEEEKRDDINGDNR